MDKVIATLELKVLDGTGPSGLRDNGGNDYTIYLRKTEADALGTASDFLQTTLAHELGHFVAKVTKDDSHNPSYQTLAQIFGPQELIPGEKKAWKIAHKINPKLNRKIEKFDLGTYGVKV